MLSSHQCHHRIIHNFMTSSYMQWPIKINPVVLHKKKQWMIKCSCTFFCCWFFPLESILAHYRNAAVKSVCKKKKEEIYTVSRKTAPQSREVYILRRSGHLDVDVHVCVIKPDFKLYISPVVHVDAYWISTRHPRNLWSGLIHWLLPLLIQECTSRNCICCEASVSLLLTPHQYHTTVVSNVNVVSE